MTRCTFPLCECEILGPDDAACRRPRTKKPRYDFHVDERGDCIVLDPEGCAVSVLHSTSVAQQVVDELNNMEAA